MTVPLPYSTSTAAKWSLYDWREVQLTTPAAAGGTATGQLNPVPDGELWLIDRMVSYCSSSTPTSVRVYEDQATPTALRDGSASGNLDVTEYPNGLLMRAGEQLVAVWSGCSDGAVGTLTAQIRVYRQG